MPTGIHFFISFSDEVCLLKETSMQVSFPLILLESYVIVSLM